MNRRVREPYPAVLREWCERAAVGHFGSPFPTRLGVSLPLRFI